MEIPSVMVRALSNQAIRQIIFGVGTGLAGSSLAQTFDETSKEICKCLDKIDGTLIDGFAGRDIESERLQEALDGVKADIAKTTKDLENATAALENARSKPSPFASVGPSTRETVAWVELRRLQEMQKALEEQLAARAKELEAERAAQGRQPGEGGQSRMIPADLAPALASI